MPLESSKKTKTKQKIMNCFWDLFQQKSIDKITVSELTSLAHINRSTFYAHFKDVYDVLDHIEEHYLPYGDKFFAECHTIQSKEEFYQTFLKVFNRNYENFIFLLSDQGDPNFSNKLKNYYRPLFKKSLSEVYQKNKCFDLTVEFVLSSMISVITYWANHTSEISSKELFDHLHDLYVHGIPYCLGTKENTQSKPYKE